MKVEEGATLLPETSVNCNRPVQGYSSEDYTFHRIKMFENRTLKRIFDKR
jgi:hypothetical protein